MAIREIYNKLRALKIFPVGLRSGKTQLENNVHSKENQNNHFMKFSETEASKISSMESLGFKVPDKPSTAQRLIILGSLAVLVVYVVFRKENQLDEILSGNYENADIELQLTNALLHARLNKIRPEEIEKLEKRLDEVRRMRNKTSIFFVKE